MGIWSRFVSCILCKSSTREIRPHNSQRPRQRQTAQNSNQTTTVSNNNSRVEPPPSNRSTLKLVQITTDIAIEDLKYSDFKAPGKTDLKYNCPVCFRYFNRILKSECCNNYICHFCVNSMNEKITQQSLQDKVVTPRCHFCNKDDVSVVDVTLSEKLKLYTDSPYFTSFNSKAGATFKSNFNATKDLQDLKQSTLQPRSPKPLTKSDSYDEANFEIAQMKCASDGFINLKKEIHIHPNDRKRIIYELKSRSEDRQRQGGDSNQHEEDEENKSPQMKNRHLDFNDMNHSIDSINDRDPVGTMAIIKEQDDEATVLQSRLETQMIPSNRQSIIQYPQNYLSSPPQRNTMSVVQSPNSNANPRGSLIPTSPAGTNMATNLDPDVDMFDITSPAIITRPN